jgi:hypothetical protein
MDIASLNIEIAEKQDCGNRNKLRRPFCLKGEECDGAARHYSRNEKSQTSLMKKIRRGNSGH